MLASNYYRASAREMKRHEAVLRSMVYAKFGEAITGTACIRAYGVENQFRRSICDSIDVMNGAYFLTFSNQRWLSVRLDAVSTALVFVTGVLVVTSRFNVSPSISGLVLSYILAIAQMLQFTVRQLAEVENNMNATERLHYYGTELEEEAPLHLTEVAASWPEKGRITFTDTEMRYRAELPLVLKGLSMDVQGGERIGIVGRTGAGKSSIMSALFRLTELSGGTIQIDGIDISTVGLNDLRSRLAIIPQDPALFKGTIRSNLDPFNEHNDMELWNALRKAYLIGQDQELEVEGEGTGPAPGTPATNSDAKHAPSQIASHSNPKSTKKVSISLSVSGNLWPLRVRWFAMRVLSSAMKLPRLLISRLMRRSNAQWRRASRAALCCVLRIVCARSFITIESALWTRARLPRWMRRLCCGIRKMVSSGRCVTAVVSHAKTSSTPIEGIYDIHVQVYNLRI